jgi:hypothetical protein
VRDLALNVLSLFLAIFPPRNTISEALSHSGIRFLLAGSRVARWAPGKIISVYRLKGDARWRTKFASVAFFSFRSEKCSFVAAYISRQEGAPIAVRDQRRRKAKKNLPDTRRCRLEQRARTVSRRLGKND